MNRVTPLPTEPTSPTRFPEAPESLQTPENISLAAEILKLISDPTRLRIILALHESHELSVNHLAKIVDKKPSGVSQHLARLRMARIVATRQEGTSVLYSMSDEHAASLVIEALKQAEHAIANGQVPPHHLR